MRTPVILAVTLLHSVVACDAPEDAPDAGADTAPDARDDADGGADGGPAEGEGAGEGEGEGEGGSVGEGEGEGEPAPAGARVLLVGNSQLGLNPPDVGAGLQAMAQIAFGGAHPLTVERFQAFGQDCAGFVASGALEAIAAGDHDVVVLLPAIDETRQNAACWDTVRAAAEDAGARFGVMATAHVRSFLPGGFTTLHEEIGSYAAEHDLLFIPAGDAWLRSLDASGATEATLYASDNEHPGLEGYLIYVYALYGALTGRATVGMPVDVPELRCQPGSCLSYEELDACVNAQGDYECEARNGALFGPNGRVAFVTEAEARAYQEAVDAALAAR